MARARSRTGGGKPALKFALLRQLHIYVSVFVAPSLLFFALTGALQTFRIPDQPSASELLVKLARVHRDDVFAPKPARPRPPEGAGQATKVKPPEKPAPHPATQALKWFFTIASIGMLISTTLGLWMALAYSRQRVVSWLLLIAGTAIPIALLVAAQG